MYMYANISYARANHSNTIRLLEAYSCVKVDIMYKINYASTTTSEHYYYVQPTRYHYKVCTPMHIDLT